MLIKQLFVVIHIEIKDEVSTNVPLNLFEPSSIFCFY